MVLAESDSSPCKHQPYTVLEAILRISPAMRHVKCITLVYPVVYPNLCHMMCLLTVSQWYVNWL